MTMSPAASAATARGRRARSMPCQRAGGRSVTATIRDMSASNVRVSRRSFLIPVILTFLLGPAVLAGCGDSSAPAQSTDAPALVPKVPVYNAPNSQVQQSLANPDTYGQPLTFLVLDQQDNWVKVALPVRPNGS